MKLFLFAMIATFSAWAWLVGTIALFDGSLYAILFYLVMFGGWGICNHLWDKWELEKPMENLYDKF